MTKISAKTKQWLLDKYSSYKDDLNDSHCWEYEHKRASEMLGILGEIMDAIGIER